MKSRIRLLTSILKAIKKLVNRHNFYIFMDGEIIMKTLVGIAFGTVLFGGVYCLNNGCGNLRGGLPDDSLEELQSASVEAVRSLNSEQPDYSDFYPLMEQARGNLELTLQGVVYGSELRDVRVLLNIAAYVNRDDPELVGKICGEFDNYCDRLPNFVDCEERVSDFKESCLADGSGRFGR